MIDPRAFPVILIVLDVAASVRWGLERSWGQALYWFFAACLTFTVTFLRMK